jgi:hypothetical protein
MDKLKASRAGISTTPLIPEELPFAADPNAHRGATKLASNGRLYSSQSLDGGATYLWIPIADSIFSLSGAGVNQLQVYVQEGGPDLDLFEMLQNPPNSPENAVGTMRAASEFANAVATGSNTVVTVNVGAGLYDPTSVWANPTIMVAWDKTLTAPKHACLLDDGGTGIRIDPIQAMRSGFAPGGDLLLDENDDHSFYPGQALGYMDLDEYPHFLAINFTEITSNIGGISTFFNTLDIRNDFAFLGGFHFVGLQDTLRLADQYYSGLHPTRAALLDLAARYGLPETAFTSGANNADVFFAAQRVAYPSATATSLGGLVNNPLLSVSSPSGRVVSLTDLTFGAMPPNDLTKGGGLRVGIIDISSNCSINFANISLVGNTTITSAGSGWTSVSQANAPPVGTAVVNAPFTYRRFTSAFITCLNAAPIINVGAWYNVFDSTSARRNFYYTPSGMLCPNHWYALDNDGDLPANDNSGPHLVCLGVFGEGLTLNRNNGFNHGPLEATGHPLYTGDYLVRQGLVGRFGSNGFNSSLTRGFLLGTTQGNLSTTFEGAVTASFRGEGTGAWRAAGVPVSLLNTGSNAPNTSHTDPGEASPVGNQVAITAPDANGKRLGTRTWNQGVDVALATIVRTSNTDFRYTI